MKSKSPAKLVSGSKGGRRKFVDALWRLNEKLLSLDVDELLESIACLAAEITGADVCLIYLLEKGVGELVLRVVRGLDKPDVKDNIRLRLGEGITGWVAEKKEIVALPKAAYEDPRFRFFAALDEQNYEAFLSVPIVYQNEVGGVINIMHRRAHRYSSAEIAFLATLGSHIGNALEKARLFEEAKRKAEQLDALSQISKSVVSNNYLEEILHLIVTVAAQVMGSKICSIMLLDDKKSELFIAATQSLSERYKNKPNLKVGQSVSGRVVQEKRPLQVLDVTCEPGYMYPDVAKEEGIVSMLCVPMMIGERVIGVINSYTSYEHEFTPEEVEMLQAVANQAAVAIERTKLAEELLAAKEALETRKVVEKAKGLIMKNYGLSEDEAYRLIQKKAMDSRKSMREIAEAFLLTADVRS